MVQKKVSTMAKANQTTAAVTGVGAGIGIVIVFLLQAFGVDIGATEAASLTGGISAIANFIIPKK